MWLAKLNTWLVPGDDESVKLVNKLEEGESIMVKHVRVRSGPWHRWYFGCCAEIGKNQEPARLTSTIDYSIRFWSGHVELARNKRGRVLEVAKRIAFEELTTEEWAELWPTFEQTMLNEYGFDPVKFKEQGKGWV